MAPLGVRDLHKIQIYRENAKIANNFCNIFVLFLFFSSKKDEKYVFLFKNGLLLKTT